MIRCLRLFTGLVLFTYLVTHLTNHATGLISLDAAQWALVPLQYPWNFPPLLALLYGSLAVHFALALYAIYQRRRLATIPFWEGAQLALGLLIVPLLAIHILGNRGAATLSEVELGYPFFLYNVFVANPPAAWQQAAATLVAWTHGVIGLYFWLRYKPWFSNWSKALLPAAVLFPVLAVLGMVSAGRELLHRLETPGYREELFAAINYPPPEVYQTLVEIEGWVLAAYFGLLAATLFARAARQLGERRRGVVEVRYPGGRRVKAPPGASILEASREGGVPHASLCGGRGRCSTCRVQVTEGADGLPAASAEEEKVLARIGAGPDVRLACQTRPRGPVSVVPLLPPSASWRDAVAQPSYRQGAEREVVILFADLRGFTTLSEEALPYDVVFILNRYFRACGEAIEAAGGRVDKFIGDGVMALFGVDTPIEIAARQALEGAKRLAEGVEEINETLGGQLPAPLKVGVGLHLGAVIVGEMGYGQARSVTAIGDAVNTASRLEAMTKDFGAQLVVSERVVARAGLESIGGDEREVEVRGRAEPLKVRVFPDATALRLHEETTQWDAAQ